MNLYEEYGKLMIQAEIINGKIQEIKGKIAEELQKPTEAKEVKEKDVPKDK